jgi:polyisoprenoid-binding protein YceI
MENAQAPLSPPSHNRPMPKGRRHWIRWILAAVALVVVAAVAAPFVYIHFIESDAPPTLDVSSATTAHPASETVALNGVWRAGSGSTAGYRVDEVLFGQNHTAVGRTHDVSGQITLSGTEVKDGKLVVDLNSVTSDRTQRDNQFRGRIMDVASFPTATFTLTQPIELGRVPSNGQIVTAKASGTLTLRGTTKPVSVAVKAVRSGNMVNVSGSIPIRFADWNIPNPSFGPVTTQDHGEIEFLVAFTHA